MSDPEDIARETVQTENEREELFFFKYEETVSEL